MDAGCFAPQAAQLRSYLTAIRRTRSAPWARCFCRKGVSWDVVSKRFSAPTKRWGVASITIPSSFPRRTHPLPSWLLPAPTPAPESCTQNSYSSAESTKFCQLRGHHAFVESLKKARFKKPWPPMMGAGLPEERATPWKQALPMTYKVWPRDTPHPKRACYTQPTYEGRSLPTTLCARPRWSLPLLPCLCRL